MSSSKPILGNKPMSKSMTIIVIVLSLVGAISTNLASALGSGDWSVMGDWVQSDGFWQLIMTAGGLLGLRKAVGQTTTPAQ